MLFGGNTYGIQDRVFLLNPDPTDTSLVEFYENVNIGKGTSADDVSFFEDAENTDNVEHYYRQSKKKALLNLCPPYWGTTVDVGGGSGRLFRSLLSAQGGSPERLILADFSISQMLPIACDLSNKGPFYFLQADGLNLPLKDGSVDTIFCSEVIEHVYPDKSAAMTREFYRVLKPGGHLLLTTPNRDEYRRTIQESILSLLLILKKKDRSSLSNREALKASLFKSYLKVSGHTHVAPDEIEKNKVVGHFNVIKPKYLRKQMQDAGFRIARQDMAIFIPLIHSPIARNTRAYAGLLAGIERVAKLLWVKRRALSCQMYLCKK